MVPIKLNDMIKTTLFILTFLMAINMYPQKKISTDFKYKATYDLTYSLDSTDLDTKKSEDMILFLSDDISSYSSKAKLIGNSVVVRGNTLHTSKESLTDFQYIIIKNRKENYLAYTLQIVDDYFRYEQNLNLFDWKLYDETKVVNGYNAQKATVNYSGRDYIAWFTNEIPISDGPFKFNGLPGLIIELSDTENHYHFLLKGFEELKPSIAFKINLKRYILIDREKLSEVWQRYKKDPFNYANRPNVRIAPEVHKEYIRLFTKKLAEENNPIEKK